jgi:hypothetical protein
MCLRVACPAERGGRKWLDEHRWRRVGNMRRVQNRTSVLKFLAATTELLPTPSRPEGVVVDERSLCDEFVGNAKTAPSPESSPENEKSEIQKSTVALFFTVFYDEPAAAGGRTAASGNRACLVCAALWNTFSRHRNVLFRIK